MERILTIGALLALAGVAAGAFGAHSLRGILPESMMDVFETGVRYHQIHALGMLIAGLSGTLFRHQGFARAGWMFLAGIVIFSGSLYILALSGIRSLGILTPFGGLAFLIGWFLLAKEFWKIRVPGNSSQNRIQ